MKVLQVINSLATGGAEKLLLETIPKYREAGIEMDVLLLNGKETPFLIALRKRTDCTIYLVSNGSVYNPLYIFKLKKYLKRYTIIHVHLFPSLYWVGISKFLFGIKATFIYTEHSTNNKRRNYLFRHFDRWIYKKYKTIIAISENVKQNLIAHLGAINNNVIIINNGIDISRFMNASESKEFSSKQFQNKNILIQVSRFYYPKDQNTVIRSLKHLDNAIELALVGDGREIQSAKQLVSELDLERRVHFLGLREDVPQLLKASDIVILSSKYEGLSLSSIEGMASGRPFIASDVPGLSEVVEGAGILFSVGDEKELATHIIELLENSEFYNQVAIKCQKRAAQYSIEAMVVSHINIYRSIDKT